jgi:hypothetical protein
METSSSADFASATFRQARTSIVVMAWLGLVALGLLGLSVLAWTASDQTGSCLYLLTAATCFYGLRAFWHLLRCGRNLAADGDLGAALGHHRLFWLHGAILSGLLLAETSTALGMILARRS